MRPNETFELLLSLPPARHLALSLPGPVRDLPVPTTIYNPSRAFGGCLVSYRFRRDG